MGVPKTQKHLGDPPKLPLILFISFPLILIKVRNYFGGALGDENVIKDSKFLPKP